MCGIAGIAGAADPAVVRRMADLIAHRGPDGEGYYHDDHVALAARRLSIVDLPGSNQPIWNEDRTVVTVFNGEIYNYKELRRRLETKGHLLRTSGDTEVVVHLYEEYGDAGVHLLRGMFAYALWDTRTQRLLLVRDRLGIKPLYYAEFDGSLAFASELRALLAVPEISPMIDADSLALYLSLQYVPGPATAIRQVRKLLPGEYLIWQRGCTERRRYWNVVLDEGERRLNEATAAEEFQALLAETVKLHTTGDVPIGVLLSGGIDSAAITGFLARSGARVRTFTVGFTSHGADDELDSARTVARYFETDHKEILMGPALADHLPNIISAQDEPIADPAAIPTFFICQFASRYVKVVLTGEGGDELLGGYPRYAWLMFGDRLRGVRDHVPGVGAVAALLRSRFPDNRIVSRGATLLADLSMVDRHLQWIAPMSESLLAELGTSRSDGWDVVRQRLSAILDEGGPGNLVHRLMYLDFKTWLPDDVLMKTDKMSMATSIEARVPFLDHRLVEFVARLPSSVKVRNLGTKALLRHALQGRWPAAVLARKKRAFLVPLRSWFRSELRELLIDTLTSARARQRGIFTPAVVDRLLHEEISGVRDRSRALWTLLCLELWLETVVDAPAYHHG